MPWILVSMIAVAIAGIGMVLIVRKTSRLGPSVEVQEVPSISDRQAVLIGLGLTLIAVLTIGFTDMSMWFLPVAAFLTVWIPQVARKAASPRQTIMVSAMFTVAMIASVLIQMLVID